MAADLIGRDGEPLVIEGLTLPYDERITVKGKPESFAPGAFSRQFDTGVWSEGVPLEWQHETYAICDGARVEILDTAGGLFFRARIPDDPRGRHAASVSANGAIAASIEFFPISDPDAAGCIARSRLKSIGLTGTPSYSTAVWRSDDEHLPNDVAAVRARFRLADMLARTRKYGEPKPEPAKSARSPKAVWSRAQAGNQQRRGPREDLHSFARAVASGDMDRASAEMLRLSRGIA